MVNPILISSSQNPKVKQVRQLLSSSSARKKHGLFVLETPQHIRDYYRAYPDDFHYLFLRSDQQIPSDLDLDTYLLEESIFNTLSTLDSPPGYLAVIKRPSWDTKQQLQDLKHGLILDQVKNPSNMGAIIRNAAAFGLDAVLLMPGCVDPYHPESLRAMVGTCSEIPLISLSENDFNTLQDKDFQWVCFDPHASMSIQDLSFSGPTLFIFGSESNGIISPNLIHQEKVEVKIPMCSKVESLNVAVSSGIALFMFHLENLRYNNINK